MDRARKSLSSLRQAASMRPPPSPSMSLGSAAGTPAPVSPVSGSYLQESGNPLFDLARAAAPSTSSADAALRRAASPSSASMDSDLARAAAPSFGSGSFDNGSHNGRVANNASPRSPVVAYNPILSREMQGMGVNPASAGAVKAPWSPASTQLSSIDVEDPGLNKANLSSSKGSSMNLLRAPQNIVLVPARYIKEKTWGTPKRRACTSICLLIFFIIFIYLIVRLVDVLRILNSSPSVQEFRVADMCSSTVKMSVNVQVLNPSSAGATVRAMRTEIHMGNASLPNGTQLVGYIITPDIYIGSGNATVATSLEAEIPMRQAAHVRKMINTYLKNSELDVIVKVPLTASFAADVFIVPISYSTTLELKIKLPALNATSNSTNTTEPEEERPRLIKMVELLGAKNPLDYVAAQVVLELFTAKDFAKSFLEITAPPLHFDVYMGNQLAVSGSTSFFHYGKKLPAQVPGSDFGSMRVTAATGTPNIPGVHFGLTQFMNKGKIPIRGVLRGANWTNPEVSRYRTSTGRECYIQNVLDGVEYELELDVNEMTNPTPVTKTPTRAPTTARPTAQPTAEPYFDLTRYELDSITSAAVLKNKIAVDLKGMDQLYGIRGVVPPVQVFVDVENANPQLPPANVFFFSLPNSFSFYPNDSRSFVPNIPFDIQFNSATDTIRVADKYFLNNNDVKVFVRTSSTGSILSRLLSAAKLEFSLKELLGSDNETTPAPAPSGRRLELSNDFNEFDGDRRELSIWANKSVLVDVTSGYTGLGAVIKAKGFDTDFFGGTRIVFKTLALRVEVIASDWDPNPIGYGIYVPIVDLTLSGYDTNVPNSELTFTILTTDEELNADALYRIVENATTQFHPIRMFGKFRYNNLPTPTTYFGSDFVFQRTQDAANATSEASPSVSFFQLYHVELLRLASNEFNFNIFFGIDLGDLQVSVKVPTIAMGFGQCGSTSFVTIAMTAWNFTTGQQSSKAPVTIELEDASRVLDAVSTFASGDQQNLCILQHSQPPNFLSYFLGALSLDFVLKGRDTETATPVGDEADLLDLEITSTPTQACLSLKLDLTDPNNPDNTSLSLGWGDVDMRLNITHTNGQHAEFLRIEVEEGWYGKVDAYRIANFDGPAVVQPVSAKLCFLADTRLALVPAQEATRSVLQRFYDGVAIPIGVGGTFKSRLPAGSGEVSTISGNFRAPATTLKSLQSVGGTTSAAGINATDWFELLELELVSFNGDTFGTKITFETGRVGFNVTLPPVSVRIGKLTIPNNKSSEVRLFTVDTTVPSFGFREQYPLPVGISITRIPPQDWGDTLQLLDDLLTGVADVAVGATTNPSANLLSLMIPTISFSLSRKDVVSPPTPGPDNLDVAISASSSATSASLLVDVKVLERLDYKFIWGTINCRLFDGVPGTSNEIGRIFVPGQVLQEANSGPMGINATLYGQAVQFAQRLFNGSVVTIGFQGTIGSSTFTSYFKVPISVTTDVAVGDEESEDDAASSFKITNAAILGADSPGSSGTFPCPLDGYCTNTIKSDADGPFQGITGGVTLEFTLPKIGRIRWRMALLSPVYIAVSANGGKIGTVVLWPLSVQSTQSVFYPVASVRPNNAALNDLRSTISQVVDGYDTAFSFSGDSTENYLSKLGSAIQQRLELLDVPEPDPDAPSAVGALQLSVLSSIRTRAVLNVAVGLLWDSETLVVSVGSLRVEIRYGHTKTCGAGDAWCVNSGIHVATASTYSPLVLIPRPTEQTLSLRAEVFHTPPINSPSQQAVDALISAFIWAFEMPLEVRLFVTPVAGNPYGVFNEFSITLFATLPVSQAVSSFIDDIAVDIFGTITASLGDVTIRAKKVLKNTLDIPLLVSYYQYVIKLVDQDGVDSGGCGLPILSTAGLWPGINPCWFGFCYGVWNVPTPVGPLITSGNPNQLRPGTSILIGKKYLEPNGGTGDTDLEIDSTIETTVRLLDEMMTKGMMCGDIADGIVLVGLQADRSCNDANRLEADLQCTFPLRIKFSLPNYPLSDLDTCGSLMEVPNYLGFTYYVDGLTQFTEEWTVTGGPAMNPGPGVEVQLLGGGQSTRTTPMPVNTEDSFQIEFQARIDCDGEGMSLTFLGQSSNLYDQPRVPSGCTGCYASRGITTGLPYASLVLAYYGCNSLAWVVQGQTTPTPYRGSQSCVGGALDNGNWGTVTFSYNAHDKRATASYEQSGYSRRAFDFDLDLKAQLGGNQYAFPAMVANSRGSCSYVGYRNIVHRGPRTNGLKTTVEGGFSLVKADQQGSINFRARDENNRKRGKGGNLWLWRIRTSLGAPASLTAVANPIIDNQDGTYTLRYNVKIPGRYTVEVACQNNGAILCNNPGVYAVVTSGLFIRAK